MKSILLLIIIPLLIIGSCSPERRLNRIVRNHPELVTTHKEAVKDTMKVPGEKGSLTIGPMIHQSQFDSLLHEYSILEKIIADDAEGDGGWITISTGELTPTHVNQKKLNDLKKQIIRSVVPDTSFLIKQSQTFYYDNVPVIAQTDISIKFKDGFMYYEYYRKPITIPYTKEEITQEIDARIGTPFYRIWWFWLFWLALIWILRKPIIAVISPYLKSIPK